MVNIAGIIGYLIVAAYSGVMYWFLHSHFFYIILIILAIAPVISVIAVVLIRRFVSVSAELISEQYTACGDEAYFMIKIQNPTPFAVLDARIYVTAGNAFFETEGTQVISVPIHARKGYTLSLPINAGYPGIVRVGVKRLDIKDILGFFYVRKKTDAEAETTVLPLKTDDVGYEAVNLEHGMLESDESTKRGSDFSDVQEIREYIPGDRLMSIHWKLSAKRDILMVKDRVSMSDRQLVIMPELCGTDKELLARILSVTYTLIHQMVADRTTVRLMYFSVKRYEYEDIRIDYPVETDEAFLRMFYEKTYNVWDEAASHMPEVHPEIKAYLHVTAENNEVAVLVRENE